MQSESDQTFPHKVKPLEGNTLSGRNRKSTYKSPKEGNCKGSYFILAPGKRK